MKHVYTPTIGLEVHAELKTRTKMFCTSANDPFAAEANVHVCPVCMAHPGTLPVINKEAVRHVLKVGAAIGATLADYTEFDRKNYFYPDLPKGYQISQYEYPLATGGEIAGVALTRIHLEEDTASSIHSDATGATVIDYNRAGVPLMELVTEPVIESAEQAGEFARELQLLLRYLDASDANMEKGEMRVEANVSVRRADSSTLGTKVEIKNLNSFNAMERAIRYEVARHMELLERGERVMQETLGWDERRQATFPQRTKEGSADYRYFPDPDLPSLKISEIEEFSRDALIAQLPELPAARRARYLGLGISKDAADLYVRDTKYGDFFDAVAQSLRADETKTASNYIANDLVSLTRENERIDITVSHFCSFVRLVAGKKITSKAAKELLGEMARSDVDPDAQARERGLLVESDAGALDAAVKKVIEAHPAVVAEYRGGKTTALEYLLGQCMRELKGRGDPVALRAMLQEALA